MLNDPMIFLALVGAVAFVAMALSSSNPQREIIERKLRRISKPIYHREISIITQKCGSGEAPMTHEELKMEFEKFVALISASELANPEIFRAVEEIRHALG